MNDISYHILLYISYHILLYIVGPCSNDYLTTTSGILC